MEKINAYQSSYQVIKNVTVSHENDIAIRYFYHAISYKQLLYRINQFAHGLKNLGIEQGDVVTTVLPNIPEAVYLVYAANQIGAIINPLLPLLPKEDVERTIAKTKSKLIFCLSNRFEDLSTISCANVFAIDPAHELPVWKRIFVKNRKAAKMINFYDLEPLTNDVKNVTEDAFYLNSGGTTGIPKIVRLSSFAMNSLSENTPFILDGTGQDYFSMLCVLPFFHGYGLGVGLHFPLSYGGTCVLMPKFNRKMVVKYLSKKQISVIIGIPILYQKLLKQPGFAGKKLRNLIFCFVGGDYVHQRLLDRFNKRMGEAQSKCKLFQGYGLTETMSLFSVNTFINYQDGTVGKPLPNTYALVVDEEFKEVSPGTNGQLLCGGNTLMNGYLEGEDPFITLDGKKYVLTGDNVSMNKDGYITYNQRIKRILKISGISIFPHNVEEVLQSFDFVYESAAIGINDDAHGTMLKIFIVLHKHYSGTIIDAEKLIREKLIQTIGIYANPKEVVFTGKLPHSPVGKIDYLKLN